MTSKEALEVLETLADNIDYKDYSVSTQNLVNKCFGKLEAYLERLEELEKENKKAQTYFIEAQKILNKDINNLLTENASLKKGIETLTIKNKLLQEECDSIADTNVLLSKGIENLTKENQELKERLSKYE